MRWFEQHARPDVVVRNVSDSLTGFQIAGPRAREVLAACTRDDATTLKFLDVRRMVIGMTDCLVQRVSYTGDLGYEIYCDPLDQRALWQVLWQAGQAHGMVPFGMRAMMSLRLDRFFGSWMAEFSPDYTPAETGLDCFIKFFKNSDFIGKSAALHEHQTGPSRRLVSFHVDADDADVQGYEPIWLDGQVVGFCTSGGFAHHTGTSIALGFMPADRIAACPAVEIEILGQMRPARMITEPLFDPEGQKMRG
jgi:dimethylglycine dehydrogenase